VTTAGDLVEETLGLLESYSLDEEQSATLSADIGSADLTFTVNDARGIATGLSPGIVEIDSELFYVSSVDDTTATVEPWGRGYKKSTAAAHTAGSRVVSQPLFPRHLVLTALNETLNRVFPDVFAVKQTDKTVTVPVITYDMPDDTQWILEAAWQVPNGMQYWKSCKRVRLSPTSGISGLGDITADVADCMYPGAPLRFIYAASPVEFTSEADDWSVCGLHDGMKDVIKYGAAVSPTISSELSRLQMATVEQQDRAKVVSESAALTTSRLLDQMFQQRLMEERKTLQRLYPPRVSGSWY
jgi:hypothetical protein